MADAVTGRAEINYCQPCLRKDITNMSVIYCEDCGEYQCKECEKVHKNFPVMSKHKLMNVNNAGDVGSKYDMKGLDQCKEHQKLMEFFCEDEKMPCCVKCAVVSHRKCHHVVEIEKSKELQNLHLLDIQREFLEIEEKFKKIPHFYEMSKDRFIKDAQEITDKIQSMQDRVNEMFENLKQTISKDIAAFQRQAFDEFETKSGICDSCIADLKHTVAAIQDVSEQGSHAQQLIMANHIKDKRAELKTQAEKLSSELKDVVLTFDFDDFFKLPPAQKDMPGKLTMKFITAQELSSDVIPSLQKEQKVNIKLMASIELKKGKGRMKEPLISDLDFLPDGRLVTLDIFNKRCLVFNQNLERLNSFTLSTFPYGLVVLSEDEVAITTGQDYILIFLKISRLNEISVIRNCNVNTEFHSISVIDNNSMLVGCIDDPQPVRVVSMKGEEGELGIIFPPTSYPIDSSVCTYIKNRNKVVVSDRFAHTVYIHDRATNTRVEVKNKKIIKEPRGLAVGPADCIFVCNQNTNSIVQISHTGQILSTQVLGMHYPCCVSVSKDNTRLAVSNACTGNMKLQLFNIEVVE